MQRKLEVIGEFSTCVRYRVAIKSPSPREGHEEHCTDLRAYELLNSFLLWACVSAIVHLFVIGSPSLTAGCQRTVMAFRLSHLVM